MAISLLLQSKYSNIESHLKCLSRSNFNDFNACMDDFSMIDFCETYKLRNLVKHPTCFKNPKNPSCTDLLLTNKALRFQTTTMIETELSDFHKINYYVFKRLLR